MKTREELAKVFEQTLEDIQVGGYQKSDGTWQEFPSAARGMRFYPTLPAIKTEIKRYPGQKVYVENIDTFQKAQVMGPGTAVLNMASFIRPGGGVEGGSRAQEEDLCRRSNLVASLYGYSPDKYNLIPGLREPGKYTYPIPTYGGIYTKTVMVYKTAGSYSCMDNPFTCSVISVPAVKRPELTKDGMMCEKAVKVMKGKIRAILRIALMNGHSKLVLGAFGCGAFSCPSRHVALLFKEVLQEKEFDHSFEEICFAIIEDKNSLRNNKEGNLKPFKEIFG